MSGRLLLFFFLLTAGTGLAQPAPYYEYNDRCDAAYNHYMALHTAEGDALIRQEKAEHPANLMAVYISDYADFLPLLLNGDPDFRRAAAARISKRLAVLETGPRKDAWYRFALAGIHLHRALVALRCDDRWEALGAFRKSYSLLEENGQQFPAFAPNVIFLGLEEAAVGTLPEEYKWISSILGLKRGDVRGGTGRISQYLSGQPAKAPLRAEAHIYELYLRFYLLSQQKQVWDELSDDGKFPVRNNLVNLFVRANIALNFRRADEALKALTVAAALPNAQKYPAFDYEMGNALLMKLDSDCVFFHRRFIANNTGRLFTKDALQKIAFAQYLMGHGQAALTARQSILGKGSTATDADKGAQRFAEGDPWPNARLLKARLLTDGGYYAEAAESLKSSSEAGFSSQADKAEYWFRLGRIADEQGRDGEALQHYQRSIAIGRELSPHFAARSALQSAFIYEARRQSAEALRCYRLCLSMRHHDFQSSIDQQAKAGIARMGGN